MRILTFAFDKVSVISNEDRSMKYGVNNAGLPLVACLLIVSCSQDETSKSSQELSLECHKFQTISAEWLALEPKRIESSDPGIPAHTLTQATVPLSVQRENAYKDNLLDEKYCHAYSKCFEHTTADQCLERTRQARFKSWMSDG